MTTVIAQTVEARLRELLPGRADEHLGLEAHLFDELGLTSINLVVLMTSLCEDLDVSLFEFTETDLGRIKRLRDLIDIFAVKRGDGSGS